MICGRVPPGGIGAFGLEDDRFLSWVCYLGLGGALYVRGVDGV